MKKTSDFKSYKKEIMEAARDDRLRLALTRAIKSFRANVKNALEKFPHTVDLAQEVVRIKEKSIPQMEELARRAVAAIEENNGRGYIAGTAEEALKIIADLVGTGKVVVKGKTMTGEEIGLREHLEAKGNEVYETDLGEFIIQKMGSRPMHITSPAIHVPREDVARLFSKVLGQGITEESGITEMVAAAREYLRDKFFQADIGISGANVVAAETGTLFIIENEGNVRLSTSVPPVHIALVGMEKLVPTISDAFKVAEVTWRYANYTIPSYVSLISGPSKTGDIEKVTTYGAHGPKEFHVIFLDGGRTRLAKHPRLMEALYCLRCGACLYECPVFGVTAGHFGDKYFAGIGAVWAAIVNEDPEKAASIAYTCLTCGRCKQRCPVDIDIPEMIIELRKLLAEGE
ncbi:MAG TPA: lactate utilization protein B [Dehalococcoidales bacterium]|nr:MAG: lactate utilization protein C [Chloroflexi bacterium RBG_16_60_22]HJX13932.1 lactate utilization protein B [Dehalococcoidales bacterium]